MTVYALLQDYDYEGSSLEGVFATLDGAKAEAQKRHGSEPLAWIRQDNGYHWSPTAWGGYGVDEREVQP